MTAIDVYNKSIDKWSKNKGVGTITYDTSIDIFEPIKIILNKYFNANPSKKVIVITATEERKQIWSTKLLTNFNHYDKIGNNLLRFMTADYIVSYDIKEEVELIIIDQIDKFLTPKRLDILGKKYITFKFICGVTNTPYPDKDGWDLYQLCPVIDRVTKVDVITHGVLDGIEEYNLGIGMSDNDKELYSEYNEFIKDTIDMFGNFDMVMKCYQGDSKSGISADHFRNLVAKERGWSTELDLNIDYYKSIDRYFNPNALYERAKTFSEIIRKRQHLMSDNDSKLEAILNIIENNKDKKILIINKRTVFARRLCNLINKNIDNPDLKVDKPVGTLFKPASDNIGVGMMSNFMCVEYHPDVDSRPLVDPNTGDYVRIKSGKDKGKIKQFGAVSLNKIANQRFNEGYHNVISSVSSIPKEGSFNIDFIIITSPECNTLSQLQYRLSKLTFIDNVKVINIFLKDTKELDKLKELQALNRNKITEIKHASDTIF